MLIGQLTQIKEVIKESYRPDASFKGQGVKTMKVNPSFSQMPIECIVMEVRSCLWDTPFIIEYQWFKAHMIGDVPYLTIAELIGMTEGQVVNRVDAMLDDAVYRMPRWLANRCLDIYDAFLKIEPEKVRPTRKARPPYKELARVLGGSR